MQQTADPLSAADRGVVRMHATRNDRWYPLVHIAARAGWINDPNGLVHLAGRYHVYFQHNPFGSQWGLMHWGHVSSADLVHWRHEPIALAPELEAERDGVFSGSAVALPDHQGIAVLYTGHRWLAPGLAQQVQCLATSTDATTFVRHGVVIEPPEQMADFRDPKVWRTGNRWYLVLGASPLDPADGRRHAAVWLYSSDLQGPGALRSWRFEGVLYRSPIDEVFMAECPDFFPLGDRWVLSYCAMGTRPHGYLDRNVNNARYVVGDWAPGRAFTPVTGELPCDWGHSYYAPQTMQSPDGRRLVWGWMGSFGRPEPVSQSDGWCGQLTVPRELDLGPGDAVLTRPVRELTALRRSSCDLGPITVAANTERSLAADLPGAAEIELALDLAHSDAERITLAVHRTPDGHQTLVVWDGQSGRVHLDRGRSGAGDRGSRSAPCAPDAEGLLRLRVFLDLGSVEVFVGDGDQVISSMVYPPQGPRAVAICAECGDARLAALRIHHLDAIF